MYGLGDGLGEGLGDGLGEGLGLTLGDNDRLGDGLGERGVDRLGFRLNGGFNEGNKLEPNDELLSGDIKELFCDFVARLATERELRGIDCLRMGLRFKRYSEKSESW